MRRLSNVFLKVGMIVSIICIASWFIAATVMFVLASPAVTEFVEEGIRNGDINTSAETVEGGVAVFKGVMIGLGVTFTLLGALSIPAAITCAKARNSSDSSTLIAAIVFSALNLTEFGIAGGVLGLIARKKEARSKIVDAQ